MTRRRGNPLALLILATALLLGGGLAVVGPATATPMQRAVDRDCGDFGTQAEAQRFFIDAGGPRSDPHALDADGDGVACETLPCPCSTSTSGGTSSGGGATTLRQVARVIRVVDGDTVKVRLRSGGKRTVRAIGIDSPEVSGTVECGGPQASRSARNLLPRGTRVTLVSDPTQANKDRYGRLLRYVVFRRKDFGRIQLRRGWAEVYVHNDKPFKRISGYRSAQSSAKSRAAGVWGLCR